MSSLIRIGINRIVNGSNTRTLLQLNKDGSGIIRTITSKALRDMDKDRPKKPDPWPYNTKTFNMLHYFTDKTTARLDENSKIVVVEGPVAAGKSKFAQELAKELDMLYLPEANLDMLWINNYGFDLRTLDDQLPESCRSFDVNNFLRNPKHRNVPRFQIYQYYIKYSQYVDALAHLLSTGQGVVLDRCCYSDFVFPEAMYRAGYINKAVYKKYYEFRDNTLQELLRPHLVIYLDVPVPKVMENIKKRNISYEVNSQVLTPQYLGDIEKSYKQKYLKEISKHAELLIYDWSDEGEVEIVIEDIERIKFGEFDDQDTKMKDWKLHLEEEWACLRHRYAHNKDNVMKYFNVPVFDVPEMLSEAEDCKLYYEVMESAPGNHYLQGYNTAMGDQGVLFKMANPPRETLPLRERRKY